MITFDGFLAKIEDVVDGKVHRGVYTPLSDVRHLKQEYQDAIAAQWSQEDIDAYKAANPEPQPVPEPTTEELYNALTRHRKAMLKTIAQITGTSGPDIKEIYKGNL